MIHVHNFCVTPKTVPVDEIIASTESACTQMPDKSEADSLRAEVVKILKNSKPPKSNISNQERNALNQLSKDKNIVILPADKGRTTVILNKTEYQQKMEILVSDKDTYTKIKSDPAKSIKNNLIS